MHLWILHTPVGEKIVKNKLSYHNVFSSLTLWFIVLRSAMQGNTILKITILLKFHTRLKQYILEKI